MRRHTILVPSMGFAAFLLAAVPATAAEEPTARVIGPSVVEVSWPPQGGALQRPRVEFDHARHVKALKAEGCQTCHQVDDRGLQPGLVEVADAEERDDLLDAYHDACIGCHQRRLDAAGKASGPLTCGECHVRRPPGVTSRIPLSFDLSLHARHTEAYPDDCGKCHHIWDEASQSLVYQEDTEEACRACHGDMAADDTPSLGNAVHQECVGCHLERVERSAEAGPVACEGCHDPSKVAAIEALADVPRLKRGQPDVAWVKAPGAGLPLVLFNHLGHERDASSCSGCHHQRLKACADCHGLIQADKGGGVTLEGAHHDRTSSMSCVGCHMFVAERGDCAGCHRDTTVAQVRGRACGICHKGASPRLEELPPVETDALPPVELAPLPDPSDDLPEEVTIDLLVDEYQASTVPHLKIIRRFDDGIRHDALATRFHGSVETMCAGCHHHSPVGERPPKCAACHGSLVERTSDLPSLKVAYHRQCVPCHQRLELKTGCTDCHAAREETS